IVIPIERASTAADRAAIGATLTALERGGIVVVFAEGRVSRVESSLGPFARGIGYLALRSGSPILPVWISGTAELYLRKELTTIAGTPRAVPKDVPTKEATRMLALALHEILDLTLELSDVLRESLEHVRPCVLVALQYGERAVPLYLEDACRDDAHGRAVTGHFVLEDHELTEELSARVKRDEELAAVLVE